MSAELDSLAEIAIIGGIGFLVYKFWNPLKDITDDADDAIKFGLKYTEGAANFAKFSGNLISEGLSGKSGADLAQDLIDEKNKSSGNERTAANLAIGLSDDILGIFGQKSLEETLRLKGLRREGPADDCWPAKWNNIVYADKFNYHQPWEIQRIVWQRTQDGQSFQEAIQGHNDWLASTMPIPLDNGTIITGADVKALVIVKDNWTNFMVVYADDCIFDEFGYGLYPLGLGDRLTRADPAQTFQSSPEKSAEILNGLAIPDWYWPGSQSELDLVEQLGCKVKFINGESVFSVI